MSASYFLREEILLMFLDEQLDTKKIQKSNVMVLKKTGVPFVSNDLFINFILIVCSSLKYFMPLES